MERQRVIAGWVEVLGYVVAMGVVCAAVTVPHLVDYGWAWGWPGGGLGFPLFLLSIPLILVIVSTALVRALVRPKRPLLAFLLRVIAVPLLLIGPIVVFGSIGGGLAASLGHGLVARVSDVTPVDALREWAVASLNTASLTELPEEVAETLPRNPRIEPRTDHVVLQWFNQGVLVGGPGYRPSDEPFFLEEVRPGLYVFVLER